MAEQLSLFSLWVEAEPAAIPPVEEDEPIEPPPTCQRQVGLFEGPHLFATEALAAIDALDGVALRGIATRCRATYPNWTTAASWAEWANALELIDGDDAAAWAALAPGAIERQFPGITGVARSGLDASLRHRIAWDHLDADGAAARLPDGRPAAALLIDVAPSEAAEQLSAAALAEPESADVQAALAVALTANGDAEGALWAWCRALILSPETIDADAAANAAIDELLDEAEDLDLPEPVCAWVPILAHFHGMFDLPEVAVDAQPSPEMPMPAAVAIHLAALRRLAGQSPTDARRVARKKALLRLVPELAEYVRRA